jgi:hypothetical protein
VFFFEKAQNAYVFVFVTLTRLTDLRQCVRKSVRRQAIDNKTLFSLFLVSYTSYT